MLDRKQGDFRRDETKQGEKEKKLMENSKIKKGEGVFEKREMWL